MTLPGTEDRMETTLSTAPHPGMPRPTCGCGKTLYRSAKSAGIAADAEFQKRGAWQKPYRCPELGNRFHLTSCPALSQAGTDVRTVLLEVTR